LPCTIFIVTKHAKDLVVTLVLFCTSLFNIAFYYFFSFFLFGFLSPFVFSLFTLLFCTCFFFAHVVSSLAYPNLLRNKKLGCYCCILVFIFLLHCSITLDVFLFLSQIKAKTISEIHSEAEQKLGLRPGSTANIRNGRTGASGPLLPGAFPINGHGTGGMMPGMPGVRKMPGMPELDNDNWEVARSKSRADPNRCHTQLVNKPSSINPKLLPQGSGALTSGKTSALVGSAGPITRRPSSFSHTVTPVQTARESVVPAPSVAPLTEKQAAAPKSNSAGLQKKTISLLEEYFHICILDEAEQCVDELKGPDYYPEVVKEAINLALDKGANSIDPLVRLLEHLHKKNIFKSTDLNTGCLLYGSLLDELAIDLPKAPAHFGEVIGRLILSHCLDFGVLEDTLKKMEDTFFRSVVFKAASKTIEANPLGQSILSSHSAEIDACNNLLS
jgi:translation initiation factor 4G